MWMTFEQMKETAAFLKEQGMQKPQIGIILGTGLGNLAKQIESEIEITYDKIPHFPVSTVESHQGKLIYGRLAGKTVIAMQGRFHYYEGYSASQITFPVRVMYLLGIKFLLISNAAGSLNESFRKGSLMILKDHINLLPDNPLRGRNIDELGPRFPDMSSPYSPYLNRLMREIAKKHQLPVNEGVYVVVAGPNLETAAEYKFLRKIGADAVGMSTVPECIVANHMGLPCCAVSVLTDECYPETLKPVELKEILEVAGHAEKYLTLLYKELIARIECK